MGYDLHNGNHVSNNGLEDSHNDGGFCSKLLVY